MDNENLPTSSCCRLVQSKWAIVAGWWTVCDDSRELYWKEAQDYSRTDVTQKDMSTTTYWYV
jgi:hypothetical protein